MLKLLRLLIRLIAFLAIPVVLFWIYLAYIAKDPVFGPEDDVGLGQQVVESFRQDPEQIPVLSRQDYAEAYAHIDRITSRLVGDPGIRYQDLFQYNQVRLIHDEDTLNAFCTPGGFIYVYTVLIKYLEREDHLAGVMGLV